MDKRRSRSKYTKRRTEMEEGRRKGEEEMEWGKRQKGVGTGRVKLEGEGGGGWERIEKQGQSKHKFNVSPNGFIRNMAKCKNYL